jgi:adenosine deaminase
VNTDDPALLGVKLEGEYARCAETFNWSKEDISSLARMSIEASFADRTLKKRLTDEIAAWQ